MIFVDEDSVSIFVLASVSQHDMCIFDPGLYARRPVVHYNIQR